MGQLGPLATNWRPGGLTNRVGQEACGYSAYSIKIRILRAEHELCRYTTTLVDGKAPHDR